MLLPCPRLLVVDAPAQPSPAQEASRLQMAASPGLPKPLQASKPPQALCLGHAGGLLTTQVGGPWAKGTSSPDCTSTTSAAVRPPQFLVCKGTAWG